MESTTSFKRDHTFMERAVLNKWFWMVFVVLAFGYPIYRSMNRVLPPDLPVLSELPNYELVNDFSKSFGTLDLTGKTYIANFVFTNCPTTCPAQMEKTQKIQKRVRGLGQKVALVTFTVDPQNDSPEVLHKYARSLGANPNIWTFLTSTSSNAKEQIKELLVNGFKVPMGDGHEMTGVVDQQEVTLWDIVHSERFVLVDNKGRVRGYYSTTTDDINKLMIDVGLLVNRTVDL